MDLITELTGRIERYCAANTNPCKNYATFEAADKATLEMARQCAFYFHKDARSSAENGGILIDMVRPARYVVFHMEQWGRWVGCIDLGEVMRRPESTGGYLGVCSGFFTY